jgi:capsule biosynthesis phosphatase
MVYVFDIDGTICTNSNSQYYDSIPIVERISKINELYEAGNKIIFFSARGMSTYEGDVNKVYEVYYELTKKQLDQWLVKYDQLILGKPSADYYIDDKGIKDEDFF